MRPETILVFLLVFLSGSDKTSLQTSRTVSKLQVSRQKSQYRLPFPSSQTGAHRHYRCPGPEHYGLHGHDQDGPGLPPDRSVVAQNRLHLVHWRLGGLDHGRFSLPVESVAARADAKNSKHQDQSSYFIYG